MKQRLAVPFYPNIRGGSGREANAAADELNKLIQRQAEAGWTYSHIDNVTTVVNQGCLGLSRATTSVQMAIFEREG